MTIKKLDFNEKRWKGMPQCGIFQTKINEIIKEFEEEKKVSDNRFNNLIKEIREIKDWINIHSNPDYNPTLCQETGSSSSGPGVESYSKTSGSNPTEPRPDIPKRDQFPDPYMTLFSREDIFNIREGAKKD